MLRSDCATPSLRLTPKLKLRLLLRICARPSPTLVSSRVTTTVFFELAPGTRLRSAVETTLASKPSTEACCGGRSARRTAAR